ncbi:uncharacterized protein LOC124273293 isoform X8 [Haliotis rubra]|uniref:uncharacterized protein LOC124273293 isoform X8 n=1 Tax=Haliotis rubra TaxID=36100 RepID=UPI001EE50860|nr:uncharacterized protein LOC124273293 isoform X8 [Haliotis rubra]
MLLKTMLNQNHLLLLLGLAGFFISDISMTTSAVSTSTTAGTPISTGAAQIDSTCPGGVGLFGTSYTIVGDRSNYTGFVWVRPSDDRNVVICNPSCSPVEGYKATNDTPSALTIESVEKIDAGTWSIVDAKDPGVFVDVCKLTVAKTPECTVSSDGATDALDLDTTLLLTVNVTDYYCSELTGLSLITGAVLETLKVNHNVSHITSDVINQTVSINLSSLGDVRVRFMCDDTSYNLSCRGVQRLLKSPPQCNISSDTGTNALELGTNLTLTMDLRGYYCSQQAGFDLTTGSVTDVLLQNQTTNNITDTVQHHSFNVTSDRFGDVSVIFRCDSSSKPLTCGGVSKLTECVTNFEIGRLGYKYRV